MIGVKNKRFVLERSAEMDSLIIDEVQKVNADYSSKSNRYEGLIYMMYRLSGQKIIPLYIGKSEKYGKKSNLSENMSRGAQNRSVMGASN